jgi:hypothetical protein
VRLRAGLVFQPVKFSVAISPAGLLGNVVASVIFSHKLGGEDVWKRIVKVFEDGRISTSTSLAGSSELC